MILLATTADGQHFRTRHDRLPTRRELLAEIHWLRYVIDQLAIDRNNLSSQLATVIVEGATT